MPPRTDPGFGLSYTIAIGLATLGMLNFDPLNVTIFARDLTALTLPFAGVPLPSPDERSGLFGRERQWLDRKRGRHRDHRPGFRACRGHAALADTGTHTKFAHELLDQQLRGFGGERISRVDGIVIAWGDGQPRVIALESGLVTLAHRSGFARLLLRLLGPRDAVALRIPWGRVRKLDLDVRVTLARADTTLHRRHHWLQRNIFDHVPGGRRHDSQ